MPLNAVRFGAKRKVKWCKTQCKVLLNTVQNGAKCKMKSINIHSICINKPLSSHEKDGRKGQNNH